MVMDDSGATQESHNDPKVLILCYFGGRLLGLTPSVRQLYALQGVKQQSSDHLKLWQHLINAS